MLQRVRTEWTRHRDGVIRAPRGTTLTAKSWLTEAPLRMLMNNLDPEVAEHPQSLVVYGGIGRAARNWACYDKIVEVLTRLEDDQTLRYQIERYLLVPVVVELLAEQPQDGCECQ